MSAVLQHPSKTDPQALAALRAELRRLEGGSRRADAAKPVGLPAIERVLPGGGLARGALHEILAAGPDWAAAQGFAVSLAAGLARQGPVLWCLAEDGLYGPGLARLGLAPDRLILVRARRPADLLWAMEEGLKTPGLAAVLGEPKSLDLTASRRLQLAAEGSGVTGLVLRRDQVGSSVAVTRWRVSPAPSGPALGEDIRDFGLARARWQVELIRCRGADWAEGAAGHGIWLMEEGDASRAVPVAVPLADRSAAPASKQRQSG
jgi:protein ImuA